jgi:transposase
MKKLSKNEIEQALQAGEQVTAAIDLGKRWSVACWVDKEGKELARERIRSNCVTLERLYGGMPRMRIAIETGGHSNWVARRLRAMGHEVIVADARRLKVLWDTRSKDDKRDARFLAQIAARWPDLLCPVEPRSRETEQNRSMLRMREAVVRARVKLINCVRGVLSSFGEKLPACSTEAFALQARPLLPAELHDETHPALLLIQHLTTQIKVYDKRVQELCNGRYREQTRRLLTIPGVGPLTALTFVLELDGDVDRLRGSRAAGAMVGLRPMRRESGESKPELGITKEGNPMLRRYLVQCAHYILGRHGLDCALKRWGLKLAGTSKRGKKRAAVATARKLAVLLHTLWRKDVDFDPAIGLERAA